MYGDLIYLRNQATICALLEREFRRILQSKIWWFDALKSTFDSSSKCCWRTLMGRLGLIQQSLARFSDLMLWKYLWFIFKVLLKNYYGAFRLDPTELRFFVDFKRRWRRLENSLRELTCLERERERERESFLTWRACLEENLIISPGIPFSLGWGPLFIEICRDSQVLFQCHMI
jgi:hypothetical protein